MPAAAPPAGPSPFPIRPFRFGVQAGRIVDRHGWVELRARAEALGYGTFTVPDHFGQQLAPVPALQCAADATTTLRIGALVFGNDYRHPVVLAKELATLDLFSDGRLDVGLGAGWLASDYEQAGMAYDPPGTRIDRMVESIAVIRGAHAPGPFSFRGRHYTVTGYEGWPKPAQSPPPLVIGGGGRRMLTIAAEQADVVGVNGNLRAGVLGEEALSTMTADAVDEKVGWVRAAAAQAGRTGEIELNIRIFMVDIADDVGTTEAVIRDLATAFGVEPASIRHSPYALIGSHRQVVDNLREYRERWGFSYVTVGGDDLEAFAPVVAELAGT